MKLPALRRVRHEPKHIFIRFGLWSSRSKNFCTGETELGVSVYPARLVKGVAQLCWFSADEYDWHHALERLAFVVTGRIVGEGSDGEPLLRNIKALSYAIDHNRIRRICLEQEEN